MPRTSRRGGTPSHTPTVSTPESGGARIRSTSPISPSRISREQDKSNMRTLNNRLAMYIERNRQLENDKETLQQRVEVVEESKSTEIMTVKNSYEKEMNQLRTALDVSANERAKYQIDAEKYEKEAKELRGKVRDKDRLCEANAKELKSLGAKVATLAEENAEMKKELAALRPEKNALEAKLERAKKDLEDETMRGNRLHNENQTLKERALFEKGVLEQQLEETKMRKQLEISQIDSDTNRRFDDQLHKQLEDQRAVFDEKMRRQTEDMKAHYEDKQRKMQEKLEAERKSSSGNARSLKEVETKVSALTSRNVELESTNVSLRNRIGELEGEKENLHEYYRQTINAKDDEIAAKEKENKDIVDDYNAIENENLSLKMEIQNYEDLLNSEETRIGSLSQPGSPAYYDEPSRKRKRTTIVEEDITELVSEHEGEGVILIEPLDVKGQYIKLTNKAKDEVNIGGWTLKNVTNDGQDVTYKFHRTTTLQPQESCTVWSSDVEDVTHEPPHTLVMKKGAWNIGNENQTVLETKEGEEQARRSSRKVHRLASSYSQGIHSGSLYARAADSSQNCAIM